MVWYPETFQMKKGSENEDENAKCMTIFCISQSAIFVTKKQSATHIHRQTERENAFQFPPIHDFGETKSLGIC